MKLAIMGPGRIAVVLAGTMKKMKGVELYAVASRSLERAEAFAKEYGFKKAYGSYEELVKDPDVQLVYIATPHSHHAECMKLCIENKKPVLCEKAFTVNAAQTKEIISLAKEKNVYTAEAIWTRYMPSRKIINDMISSGIIGKPSFLSANLSYAMSDKPRITDPALAGGALLDIGVYGINFSLMHFGDDIDHIESSVMKGPTGVDAQETITIFYKDGKMAVVTSSYKCRGDRKGIIHGDKGYIIVENINNPQSISAFDSNDKLLKKVKVPKQITGYEYEIYEAMKLIEEGKIESTSMPFKDSVRVMEIMDGIRKDWGLVYPCE